MTAIVASGVHGEARRSPAAAALLATAERSAAGRLADASPTRSKLRRTIGIVECISWSGSLFPTPNREPIAKFHARGTVSRMNAITVSGVHGEARRLRVATALLADAWPPSRPPFCDEAGIPVDRGRNRFSFRRHFPCSLLPKLLPKLCARLLSRAHHAIHHFHRRDSLCIPVFRGISICRHVASALSRPSSCMLNPSERRRPHRARD